MSWSLSLIITLAVCIAACIVVTMMVLGGLGATSGVRSAGLFAASAIGLLLGKYVQRTYVAK